MTNLLENNITNLSENKNKLSENNITNLLENKNKPSENYTNKKRRGLRGNLGSPPVKEQLYCFNHFHCYIFWMNPIGYLFL